MGECCLTRPGPLPAQRQEEEPNTSDQKEAPWPGPGGRGWGGQHTRMEKAGGERGLSLTWQGSLRHAHPSPLKARAPETSAPETHVSLVGGAFLFSVFLSRPLQMGR